jgi:hypothetical protein
MSIFRPHLYWVPAAPCWDLFCGNALHSVMTADECQRRADEAKALALETQDLWEREMLFKIADQWQLLASHRATKKSQPVLKVVPGKPDTE